MRLNLPQEVPIGTNPKCFISASSARVKGSTNEEIRCDKPSGRIRPDELSSQKSLYAGRSLMNKYNDRRSTIDLLHISSHKLRISKRLRLRPIKP